MWDRRRTPRGTGCCDNRKSPARIHQLVYAPQLEVRVGKCIYARLIFGVELRETSPTTATFLDRVLDLRQKSCPV